MTDESPSLGQVIRGALESRLLDVHTALPARVESYDASKQTVDAKPVVKRALRTQAGDKRTEALPVIPAVPVAFPQAGGFQLTLPIAKGDHVLLVFAERNIGEWRRSGDDADPGDQRTHGLTGAIAIPGLVPQGKELSGASGSNMVMGEDGGVRVEIEPGGPMHLGKQSAGEEALALAEKTKSELDAIWAKFNAHTHSGVTTGSGSTGTPGDTTGSASSVAAQNVKGD